MYVTSRTLSFLQHEMTFNIVYVNSIVASLNVRSAVLGKGDPFQASRVVSTSTAGTESTVQFDYYSAAQQTD